MKRSVLVALSSLLLAAGSVAAQSAVPPAGAASSALDECRGTATAPADLMRCLQITQRTASDDMLGQFQAVEQRLRQRGSDDAREAGPAALRRAQREFERYVEAQCGFVHDLAGGGPLGTAAALACETDLLRQRSAVLRGLLPPPPPTGR